MTNHDMAAWLDGQQAGDMTSDQLDRFARIWGEVGKRYPKEGDGDRRTAALTAAVQYLLGETTIDEIGQAREAARIEALMTSAAAQQVALMAIEDGVTEQEAARRARIDRQWVRRLQGKK